MDAAIVRNTKQHHFCCLTINGKDYAFDGVSHRRLQKYNWRKNLEKDQEWTFKAQKECNGILEGYYILFYYRTNKIFKK